MLPFFNDYCVIDLLPFLNDHCVNDVLPMPRWVLMLVYLAVPVKFLFSLQQTPAGFTFNLHLNFPSWYSSGGESLSDVIFIGPKSDHCLVLSVSPLLTGLVKFCRKYWICQSCLVDLLLHGYVKIDTWICKNWYMDLSKLLHEYVKVVLCICRPLPNKTWRKVDQDFKAWWSFCL